MHVPLENENRFVKNALNLSLINTDIVGLKEYKNKKEMASKINDVSAEINNMKTEMAEIKMLLSQLVNQNASDK